MPIPIFIQNQVYDSSVWIQEREREGGGNLIKGMNVDESTVGMDLYGITTPQHMMMSDER